MADRWTVVSVCNYPIMGENKPTVQHEPIRIPAADPELGISTFIVKPAILHEFMGATDKEYRIKKVPVDAKEMAEAIVLDYCNAQLCLEDGAKPGLFCVEGEFTPEEILEQFPTLVKQAKINHTLWAKKLIAMADDEWATEKRHRRIGAQMRNAAQYFGLDREWVDPTKFISTAIDCPACGEKLSPKVAVCKYCRCVVNEELFAELEFAS